MPTNLTAALGGSVVVPVTVSHLFDGAGDSGLFEGVLALTYDPTVFSISDTDVAFGDLLLNAPADGEWELNPDTSTPGEVDITTNATDLFSNPISSTTGGVIFNLTFHIKAGAPTGDSVLHIVVPPAWSPNGVQSSALPDSGPHSFFGDMTAYTLSAADQVDGVVDITGPLATPEPNPSWPVLAAGLLGAAALRRRQCPTSSGK
jgi:MYXO-CTERM domain-containing protein